MVSLTPLRDSVNVRCRRPHRDAAPPPCRSCGGDDTFWHTDPGERTPELICLDCVQVEPLRTEPARVQPPEGRARCRADIVAAVRAAGGPVTRKDIVRLLRPTGHGASTIVKALADLTAAGDLVNLLDKRGYCLPGDAGETVAEAQARSERLMRLARRKAFGN